MKLESPLLYLFKTCEKVCQADCCGIDAFDFSPIHIASYLINDRRLPDEAMVDTIREQLATLQKRGRANGLTIVSINQIFTAHQVEELVKEITENLEIAIDLAKQSEARRTRRVRDWS